MDLLSPPLIATFAMLVVAGIWDARLGVIPNWLTLGSSALAIVYALLTPKQLMPAILGCALVAGVPFLLYLQTKGRAIGGGDIKLFLAIGLWLGPDAGLTLLISALVLAALSGAIQAYLSKTKLRNIELRLGPYVALALPLAVLLSEIGAHHGA